MLWLWREYHACGDAGARISAWRFLLRDARVSVRLRCAVSAGWLAGWAGLGWWDGGALLCGCPLALAAAVRVAFVRTIITSFSVCHKCLCGWCDVGAQRVVLCEASMCAYTYV